MKFLSVCSGIAADHVAWSPLGWECVGFAEIEKHASALLAEHYPDVPNFGDFTKIGKDDVGEVDLLTGGTPCQAFSIAGNRLGMDDHRGNLALGFCQLASRMRPRWIAWENVPGVFSVGVGKAFRSIVEGLHMCGYSTFWRVLDAQYVRVESYPFAIPQRRRRVFLVGYLGDWRPPVAALLEPESLRGDNPPRRKAGQRIAGTRESRSPVGSGHVAGTITSSSGNTDDNSARANHLIQEVAPTILANFGSSVGIDNQHIDSGCGLFVPVDVSDTVTAKWAKGSGGPAGDECQNLVPFNPGTITSPCNHSNPQPGDPCHTVVRSATAPAIAFNARQDPVAYGNTSGTLDTDAGTIAVQAKRMIRRLTPVEVERLLGFPDGYTGGNYRGKPRSNGPRIKLLGNSIAVNCMSWIGQRIDIVDKIIR